MRILTRKVQESLVIGADIVLTVLRVRGDQVRFRISAPPHIAIARDAPLAQAAQSSAAAEQVQHGPAP